MSHLDLDARFPAMSDLKARARRRIPHFVWKYLVSAMGTEAVTVRNRAALDRVLLRPAALRGEITPPKLATTFLGRDCPGCLSASRRWACRAWAMGIQASSMPQMRLMDSYADQEKLGRLPSTAHVGYLLRAAPDWEYVAALRQA